MPVHRVMRIQRFGFLGVYGRRVRPNQQAAKRGQRVDQFLAERAEIRLPLPMRERVKSTKQHAILELARHADVRQYIFRLNR